MRSISTFIILICLAAGAIFFFNRDKSAPRPTPDPEQYTELVTNISQYRTELALEYRNATTVDEQEFILRKTRFLFEEGILHMMNCWLGTPWDFEGMTEQPGKGTIACGYFVSTIVKDIGIPLDRIQMAQAPSETFIRTIIPRAHIQTFSNRAYRSFITDLDQIGHGIYIIGLDTHIGFVVINHDGWRFIHSSTKNPSGVTSQSQENARAIKNSKYRVIGKLIADNDALLNWLDIH